MGCLKLENNKYLGKIVKMPKSKNNNQDNKKVIQISLGGVISVVVTIALAAIGAAWLVSSNFGDVRVDIASLNKDIGNITDQLNDATTERTEMHDYLYNDNGVQDQLGDIASDISEIKNLLKIKSIIASSDVTSTLDNVSIESNDNTVSNDSFTATTCIGKDSDGKEYIAKDLIDEMILLTYTEDDKEIYFLGQYNESYHWDGYCITNAYNSDSTLYGICESNFDDGKRLDYKSFCVSEPNDQKWIYSDKICNENSNSGTNILCSFDYDKKKNFTNTNAKVIDIVYVDEFVESVKPTVLTYYCGNTSDGKYNDDTGNAYEIIYNDDATIKTLYVGKFKDGTFNDDTGNAWDIAYSDEGGYYVYNEGEFKDGRAVNRSAIPIDIDRINEIISAHKQKFDIELKWKQY